MLSLSSMLFTALPLYQIGLCLLWTLFSKYNCSLDIFVPKIRHRVCFVTLSISLWSPYQHMVLLVLLLYFRFTRSSFPVRSYDAVYTTTPAACGPSRSCTYSPPLADPQGRTSRRSFGALPPNSLSAGRFLPAMTATWTYRILQSGLTEVSLQATVQTEGTAKCDLPPYTYNSLYHHQNAKFTPATVSRNRRGHAKKKRIYVKMWQYTELPKKFEPHVLISVLCM
jgi:hypothetical protein